MSSILNIIAMHRAEELNIQLHEDAEEQAAARRRLRIEWYWYRRCVKRLDPNWEAWWDSYPEQMTLKEFMPILKAHVAELREKQKKGEKAND